MARWDRLGLLGSAVLGDVSDMYVDRVAEIAVVIARNDQQYHFVDISDPANPVLRGTIDESGTNKDPLMAAVDESRQLAMASEQDLDTPGNGFVACLDYSDPDNPVVRSRITGEDYAIGNKYLNAEDQRSHHSFQNSSSDEGFFIVDYSDPDAITTAQKQGTAEGQPWGWMAYNKHADRFHYGDKDRGDGNIYTRAYSLTAGGGIASELDRIQTPNNNPHPDWAFDPNRTQYAYFCEASGHVHTLEWDGANLVVVSSVNLPFSDTRSLVYLPDTQELWCAGTEGTADLARVDASDPTALSQIDAQDEWPDGTAIQGAEVIRLYKSGTVGIVCDDVGDYIATFDTAFTANAPPAQPTCSVDSVDQREAELSSSAFSDPDGDPHDSSRWQVRDQGDADWSTPEYDSGWTATDLTTHTTDRVLTPGADYEARVAHRDPDGAFTWSDPVAFTTEALEEVPAIGPEGFFFGPDGRNDLLKFGGVHEDAGNPITGEMLHRAIAPRGAAGEALFRYVRVTITYATEFTATITPVLDGEELTSESVTFTRSAPSGQKTETIEVELARGSSFARRGLRGTWIRTLLELTETAGHAGYIAIDGIEYEWEPVRETTAALTFHQENLSVASLPTVTRFFFGAGNELGEFGAARDDLGTAVEAVLHSNPVAPAGSGGEAIFTNLYLALTRANPSDVPLNVTAIVDETSYSVGPVTLAGVANPKLEVLEIPLTRQITRGGSPVGRAHLRGSWCEIEVDTDGSLPDGDIIFETAELEHEVVQESEGDVGG